MRRLDPRWALAILPLWVVGVAATGRAIGRASVDLAWAVWRQYAAGRGELPISHLIGWPEGLDVATMAPGWLDVGVGGLLGRLVGPLAAYDLTVAGYVVAAGAGGYALARALGVSSTGALVAGLVMQLDAHLWHHVEGGRIEHGPIGLVALALAGAIRLWAGGGWREVVGVGALGALVVASSWELGLVCALATVILGLALLSGPRPAGAVARWLGAGIVTAALAAPLVLRLVAAQRGLPDAAGFGRWLAAHHAVGLLGLARPGEVRPPYVTWVAIAALPWVARGPRRVWAGLAAAAAVTALAALGPHPGLFAPTSPRLDPGTDPSTLDAVAAAIWAPWTWLQQIPGLGRYHWPERLLATAGLLAAPACGAWVDGIAENRRRLVGAALVVGCALEVAANGWAPWPRFRLEDPPELVALGAAGEGALVNLPPQPNPSRHSDDHWQQLVHGHPILFSMQLRHLQGPALDARVAREPVLRWFADLAAGRPVPRARFTRADLATLRGEGFRFVSLHRAELDAARWQWAREALADLGPPDFSSPGGRRGVSWMAWDLDAPPR